MDPTDHDTNAELSFGVPATYVNRHHIRVGVETTRMAFGEAASLNAPSAFRLAIVMPTSEALNLARLLLHLAEQLREQVSLANSAIPPPGTRPDA